jgi:hypothetical protein
MARLSLRERRYAWRVARESWIEAGRDPELAKKLAEEKVKTSALPPIVIEIIVRIIIGLIVEWMNSKKDDPAEMPPLLQETPFDQDDEDDV